MARKPSPSNRGSRTSASASQGGRARRTSAPRRANDATRGKSNRAPGQRGGAASRLAGQPDHAADIEDLRAGGRDGASEQIENRSRLIGGLGATETSGERQGMGRGHRRNFDESDDDATTRGQSTADETSDTRDSGVRRHSRAMDDPLPHGRPSSRGGRSGRRSDW